MTITTVVVKPKSRGYVRLRSADPNDMPLVSPQPAQGPGGREGDGRRPALLPARLRDQALGRAHQARSPSRIRPT